MARVSYREGDWFAVPLRDGGFAVGVIARANEDGALLGYFFGPKRAFVPSIDDIADLGVSEAELVGKFGHLGLKHGTWPIIGQLEDWDRTAWPMPVFGRFEELTGRAFAVKYADDDPNSHPRETEIEPVDLARYPRDGLMGAGYVEIVLSKSLQ
jgi:hypothetical protein